MQILNICNKLGNNLQIISSFKPASVIKFNTGYEFENSYEVLGIS